ncbi:transcriptional antiterminator [Pullulanibacillus camelliae]|uniref:Transcriptional antiterminator n=1 Tax=Pullulanibacillus camelliae TaxID=1707096 RepID=A0A8J2VKK7_9BACL|nr:BglG family transcription antiterminator [Pullulanibacillus camelliae]GGE27087.1 transcriptional antiterminator [Pullulanibacillus camelliae]
MALDHRSSEILQQLIVAENYVSIQWLMETFNISRRTVYYDLDKINNWLLDHNLSPVKKVRSAGFYLENGIKDIVKKNIEDIQGKEYEYTARERQALMLLYLLSSTHSIFLDDMVEQLRVSQNTVSGDIKQLKKVLNAFQLNLVSDREWGYHIIGSEKNRRKAMTYYLSFLLPEQSWNRAGANIHMLLNGKTGITFSLLRKHIVEWMMKWIRNSEKRLGIDYTDDVHQHLAIRFIFFLRRIELSHYVGMDPVESEVIRNTLEFELSKLFAQDLENKLGIILPKEEVDYFTTHFLSAKVNHLHNLEKEKDHLQCLSMTIEKMIDDFEKKAFVQFRERTKMTCNMLIHLKPAYYRLLYDIKVNTPIARQIQKKYPEIFHITEQVAHHLSTLVGKTIDENEVALLAMHFGGWMHRQGMGLEVKIRALIVCANGVGTSRMLQQQLEELFPNIEIIGLTTVRNYKRMEKRASIIISTAPLEDSVKPVILVSPILTEPQVLELQREIVVRTTMGKRRNQSVDALLDIISQFASIRNREGLNRALKHYLYQPQKVNMLNQAKPELTDLLHRDNVQFLDTINHWTEAIHIAAKPLLMQKKIEPRYIKAIINSVNRKGSHMVIAPGVAIPHAKPEDGAKQIGMSLLKLHDPISFPDVKHKVYICIVLSAIDDEGHLKALSQLTHIMSQKPQLEALLHSETMNDLLAIVQQKY